MVPENNHALCCTKERCSRSCFCGISRISTPFNNTAPFVTSLNRIIREATVDFPLPVPPIIAVVFPRLQVKLRFFKVYSSASAKRKNTFSKASTSRLFSLSSTRWLLLSAIVGEKSITSPIRLQHSSARGRVKITICAIIKKNKDSMAY